MINFSSNNNEALYKAITYLSNRIFLLAEILAISLRKSFPDDEDLKKQLENLIHIVVEREGR